MGNLLGLIMKPTFNEERLLEKGGTCSKVGAQSNHYS